ncbi:hypothetical protein CEP52_012485 [Fusarium oligoseptatum]|uniref:Uncharacterized protein n=1 Tax=Fusarium oligoseptatum TaxID=2604345 RepID=A0A428SY41_9HYPO|nr:hypothetical protein CEP52_012485 [Fusarium oligoseptatum]
MGVAEKNLAHQTPLDSTKPVRAIKGLVGLQISIASATMSLRLATRRLAVSARSANHVSSTPTPLWSVGVGPSMQRRHKWAANIFKGWGKPKNKDAAASSTADPVTSQLDDPKSREQFLEKSMYSGVEDNIFQDEIETPSARPEAAPGGAEAEQKDEGEHGPDRGSRPEEPYPLAAQEGDQDGAEQWPDDQGGAN